jgi:hypothetical protein
MAGFLARSRADQGYPSPAPARRSKTCLEAEPAAAPRLTIESLKALPFTRLCRESRVSVELDAILKTAGCAELRASALQILWHAVQQCLAVCDGIVELLERDAESR